MRARHTLIFVLGVLAGVGGAVAVAARARPPATPQAEAPPAEMAARPAAAPAASPGGVPDLRPAIRARVAAVLAEGRRGHELDLYLDELERAARAQGRVTALEIVPGLEAIEAAYPGDMEKGPAFARRMEDLQRQLGQAPPGPAEPPPGVTAGSLLQAIATAPAGPARDKLIPQALTAIGRLPEADQDEASKALDRATAAGLSPGPAPPYEAPEPEARSPRPEALP
jgi:hypothetical protein